MYIIGEQNISFISSKCLFVPTPSTLSLVLSLSPNSQYSRCKYSAVSLPLNVDRSVWGSFLSPRLDFPSNIPAIIVMILDNHAQEKSV